MTLTCYVAVHQPGPQMQAWLASAEEGDASVRFVVCESAAELGCKVEKQPPNGLIIALSEAAGFTESFWDSFIKEKKSQNGQFPVFLVGEHFSALRAAAEKWEVEGCFEMPLGATALFNVTKCMGRCYSIWQSDRRQALVDGIKTFGVDTVGDELSEPINSLSSFVDLLYRDPNTFSREEIKFVTDNVCRALEEIRQTVGFLKAFITHKNYPHAHVGNLSQEELLDLGSSVESTLRHEVNRKNLKLYHQAVAAGLANFDRGLLYHLTSMLLRSVCRSSKKYAEVLTFFGGDGTVLLVKSQGFALRKSQQTGLLNLQYYQKNTLTPFEKGLGLSFLMVEAICQQVGLSFTLEEQGEFTCFCIRRAEEAHL